jgi:hypothetical protein
MNTMPIAGSAALAENVAVSWWKAENIPKEARYKRQGKAITK